MKEVYTARDHTEAHFIKNLLENAGIRVRVRGELLVGLGIPVGDRFPSIWVKDDADFDRAREVVDKFLEAQEEAAKNPVYWQCPKCGESIEDQFMECWKCSTARPTEGDPPSAEG